MVHLQSTTDTSGTEQQNEKPRIVLTTPCYGGCTISYAQSFYGASRDRSLLSVVQGVQPNSSLLPTAFNECLSHALNMRDAGEATHIAMLHSDIAAEPGWLDVLWSEMWLHHASMISAIVPIKNTSRRTSTAIGEKGNRWRVRRCLYLDDLAKLPPTFGPEWVCNKDEVLLVNTGCWLSDLRNPFWDDYAFNLHSRVKRVKSIDGSDRWTVETRSEDWELSHDMTEAGLYYLATSRVRLWHEGGGRWANHDETTVEPRA